jgi:hypothetical protein
MLPTGRIFGCRTQKRPIKNESGRGKDGAQFVHNFPHKDPNGENLFGDVFTILQPKDDSLDTGTLLT